MSEILGYKSRFDAKQRAKHHAKLVKEFPHLETELEIVYSWMNDPNFIETLKDPSKNQLQWLKTSMDHPPERLLNHLIKNTSETIKLRKFETRKERVIEKPLCFSCRKPIAENMKECVEFSQITCTCFPKTFHNECADEFVMKNAVCSRCLKNIKLTRHFSSLLSTLERR